MQNKIIVLFLFFFLLIPCFPKEYNWGKDYKITISPLSSFVSEFVVKDTSTNKILYESSMGIHYVLKTKQKKIAEKNIFFMQATTGGEGMVSSNLHYFYFENNKLKQGAVEDIIDFNLRDLDGDKNKELILTDFKYYKFRLNNCYNSLEPDPHYKGRLLPIIYKFEKNSFREIKQDNELLKKYLTKLEKKLLKKKKFKNINGYSHYYATAKKIGLEKRALDYFKENNSSFTYSCENTKEQNPKGKSFQWKTDYSSFFQKFGKSIQ